MIVWDDQEYDRWEILIPGSGVFVVPKAILTEDRLSAFCANLDSYLEER